jgi:hypothetical protein
MMVQDFTDRHLSVTTDRLPALSGLAAAVQKYTKSEYLAGLWKKDLKAGLLWYRPPWAWNRSFPQSSSYYAPSWSWASANFNAYYLGTNGYARSEFGEGAIMETEIIEAQVIRQGPYLIPGSFIRLSAQMKSAVKTRGKSMVLKFDYRSASRASCVYEVERTKMGLYNLSIYVICKIIASDPNDGLPAGLILEATGGPPNEYKRVGMVYAIPVDWLGEVELSEIVIIKGAGSGDMFLN